MFEKRPEDSLITPAIAAEGPSAPSEDLTKLKALAKLRPRILGYLRRVICDHAERSRTLSDVYSEVLVDAYSEVLSLELEHDLKQTAIWPIVLRGLRRIAREEWHRSREVRGERTVDRLVADHDGEDWRAYRLALWAWEDAAMGHLTTLQRGALELHVMDGLSDTDIAALLGCSRASVRVLRATAKKRLRALIRRGIIPKPPRSGAMSIRHER